MARRGSGPTLPYELLAGVQPCPGGWLVTSAKLQGISLAGPAPEVYPRFIDVLDHRPALSVVALHLPLGLPNGHEAGGRTCDRAARRLLGRPRSAAIASPPSRQDLRAWKSGQPTAVSAVTRSLLARIAEAYEVIGSYHQRTVFEVHPELSFFQLNGEAPLRYPKHTRAGREERVALVQERIPGMQSALNAHPPGTKPAHVVDGLAMLLTARRIRARSIARLPDMPEWDSEGLRMEFVY
ncbi:MAG TPA: DUF429 domain-containing protein [Acidimicrobiales bacterium]|nr:DUF429 domain-containing protein [Acidimicrobiales bacterium]